VYIDGEMRQFDIDLLQSTPAPTYCQHKNNSRPKRPILTMVSTERLDTLRRVFAHSTLLKEVLVQNSELMQLGPKVSYNVVTLSHVQGAAKENSVRLQEFLDHFEKPVDPIYSSMCARAALMHGRVMGSPKGLLVACNTLLTTTLTLPMCLKTMPDYCPMIFVMSTKEIEFGHRRPKTVTSCVNRLLNNKVQFSLLFKKKSGILTAILPEEIGFNF